MIYVSWWGGLGDCILYLSVIHSHRKHFGKQLKFGTCRQEIERKQSELLQVFKSDLIQTPRTEFTKDNSGLDGHDAEDHDNFDIIPNDNYDYNYAERGYLISNQIVGTSRVLRLNKTVRWLDIPLEYLPYNGTEPQRKQVTMQLNGNCGGRLDRYYFDMDDVVATVEIIKSLGIDVICIGSLLVMKLVSRLLSTLLPGIQRLIHL